MDNDEGTFNLAFYSSKGGEQRVFEGALPKSTTTVEHSKNKIRPISIKRKLKKDTVLNSLKVVKFKQGERSYILQTKHSFISMVRKKAKSEEISTKKKKRAPTSTAAKIRSTSAPRTLKRGRRKVVSKRAKHPSDSGTQRKRKIVSSKRRKRIPRPNLREQPSLPSPPPSGGNQFLRSRRRRRRRSYSGSGSVSGSSVSGSSSIDDEEESDGTFDSTTWLHSGDDDDEGDELSLSSASSMLNGYGDHNGIKRVVTTRKKSMRGSSSSTLLDGARRSASPMQRVLSGQQKSTAIAQAATWEATRLREQATTMEKRFLTVSAQLKESIDRERSLKMGRGRDKLAMKELRYRNLYLAKELAQVKDLAKESAAKTRAQMNGMANSLNTLEEASASRSRSVQREVRHLRGLLTSLQRRAVRGTGPAGFSSGERILTAMWQSIETIHQLGVPGGSPMQSRVSSRRPYFTKEPPASTATQNSNSKSNGTNVVNNNDTSNTGEMTQDLAETMDGIVGDLERENQRLRAEVEMLQTEILHHKGKTESIALIPQYRQAVIRAREHAELLRQRLRDEIQARSEIQEELARAQEEVRKLSARTASQTHRNMTTEKELAVTNLRTAYVQQAMDSTKQQYKDAYSDFATTTMKQQQVIEELQDVITAQRHQLEELSDRPSLKQHSNHPPVSKNGNTGNMHTNMHTNKEEVLVSDSEESFSLHDESDIGSPGVVGELTGTQRREGAPNSLDVLHSDLERLDEEIAELQRGIVAATDHVI